MITVLTTGCPYTVQWMLVVRISQQIVVGGGCVMPKLFFLCCTAGEDIRCDVDEMWPDREERLEHL